MNHEQSSPSSYHIPVMLQEAVEALAIRPDGIYVDCTLGGAGHTKAILSHLSAKGTLVAFDQDADAVRNLPEDDRIIFVPHNFKHISRFLKLHGIERIDGILADLGVSSHQFDEGSRGFSIRFEGPLDMRMDQRRELTAAEVVQTYSEQELQEMFSRYGEVTNAKTLAKHLVASRMASPIQTIGQLKAVLASVVKGNPNKYLAQVFQALRIEVNDELGALRELLEQLPSLLRQHGRVAFITFHSLEDRLVKQFLRAGTWEQEDENPFAIGAKEKVFQLVHKKPIEPKEEELKSNPRSRSAKLRVAERL
ncbi:MAG: 16S rRNA (cytosine(1402)-N(4))-methyltransferase RsmH [Sediminibacterium sp.]|jgi:16S rRNA (cytosine1402-N4)-methyltransferase|nr:16S rRNA (cytosine(1402)-N(4))-methyltransferase RsmH [Sediminibacterium sp.]